MGLHQTLSPSGPSLDVCSFCGGGISVCRCNKFEAETERTGQRMGDTAILNKLQIFTSEASPIIAVALNDGRDSDSALQNTSLLAVSNTDNAAQSNASAPSGASGPT